MSAGSAKQPTRRFLNLTRRKTIGLTVAVIAIILLLLGLTWQVPIDHVNERTQIPSGFLANPVFAAVTAANATGNIDLTIQSFNFTSPDGSMKLMASSATIQITLLPAPQGETDMNLTVNLSHVNMVSSTFTGSFTSLQMDGFVDVDPQTNQLVIALTASTSVISILQAILGG
jgi:hypothetical protein